MPAATAPEPENATALCLSGGGYRAMLFHLGTLWRLNELGVMKTLRRVSSVSGGSITAATLGLHWKRLTWSADGIATNFAQVVATPLHALASHTLDVTSVLSGALLPFVTVSDRVQSAYSTDLFGTATLQDLPDDTDRAAPRFIVNATNVQTGALWRFSRPYAGDYRVGRIRHPTTSLAMAVGASSAFPPFLSPCLLSLQGASWMEGEGEAAYASFRDRVVLTDGGVYDNLGLETAYKRCRALLVSDAGQALGPERAPHEDWARHAVRVLALIDHQVRSLRKRMLLNALTTGARTGAYFSIRTPLEHYGLPTALAVDAARAMELAAVETRLASLGETVQQRIVNWGYAACDTSVRRWYLRDAAAPTAMPYPGSGV